MKLMKNMMSILITFCISIIILSGSVSAATASVSRSSSKVTVGNNVSITVSFSEKVSAAQFKLTYDSSKFDFVSVSAGEYVTGTNMFAYLNLNDSAVLGNVTFTFRAKSLGTGTFDLSGLVLSSSTSTIGTSRSTVTVENAKTNNSNSNTKPSTNSNKNNNSNSNNNNANQNPTEGQPEIVLKSELDAIKLELEGKVESDYTEESWRNLQELITRAENATTNGEYDEIKSGLTTDMLVVADFEKEELLNLLIALMGKTEKDFTEESWKELQDAIVNAQNVRLKSEYDEIKDKLTIDTLVKKGGVKEFFENFIQGLERRDPLYLAFAGCVLVLLLIIVILLILLCKGRKNKRTEVTARRLK